MPTATPESNPTWDPQPAAASLIGYLFDRFVAGFGFVEQLAEQMMMQTATRLLDWVDHFELADSVDSPWVSPEKLEADGFQKIDDLPVWSNPLGMFPPVALNQDGVHRMAIHVESVADFLEAHRISTDIINPPFSAKRIARAAAIDQREFWVIEKHGVPCFENQWIDVDPIRIVESRERFQLRDRTGESAAAFVRLNDAVDTAVSQLGVDRACSLFFETERSYWQARNLAARQQKQRQDQLGLGWANHDHHTYRSSRQSFQPLIALLEKLGFVCRERFYAGAEAGWGAQVLEQPRCGIVVFADVDLTEDELQGDFAHDGLSAGAELGTVGLWCALHGEAILEAGMHHLECQFDFAASRKLFADNQIECMDPFTNFDFLKQCFTAPEIWAVRSERIDTLLQNGQIDSQQAETFRSHGAVGSHLELLERNDGYKGFNQTGVSKIIAKTDPRLQNH